MDITKVDRKTSILGTLWNDTESGVIAYSDQVYYEEGKTSVKDAITTLNTKMNDISGGGSGMVWE